LLAGLDFPLVRTHFVCRAEPALSHGTGQAPPLAGLDFPLSLLTAEDWADLLAAMSVQHLLLL